MKFMKVTAIGGIVVLIPLTVIVILVGKIAGFLSKLAAPLAAWIPLDSFAGVALADLIAIAGIVMLCFLSGLAARSAVVTKFIASLESNVLYSIPGYSFIKSMTGSVTGSEDERSLTPVLVRFDDATQMAFKVESLPDGQVVVYIPGSPDPWAGSLFLMAADRVQTIDRSLSEAVKNIRGLGAGSSAFFSDGPTA